MVKDIASGAQYQSPPTSPSSFTQACTSIPITLDIFTSTRCVTSLVIVVTALTNEITIATSNSKVDKQRDCSSSFQLATS